MTSNTFMILFKDMTDIFKKSIMASLMYYPSIQHSLAGLRILITSDLYCHVISININTTTSFSLRFKYKSSRRYSQCYYVGLYFKFELQVARYIEILFNNTTSGVENND
jgi:hypothetical protein